ncbi:MAG: leucine-rich repeat protein [Alistipes sp.]|nr:leucine-rich repeat protein [Alistipes sp.]
MKKFLLSVVIATTLALTSCQFDDSGIWDKFGEMEESIRDHEERITALEELCKQMNTNIEALQTLVDALEKRDYVTNVAPIREDGKVVGYTISFANSDTITIYNGKDGADGQDGVDGKDGYTPKIGVMKDTDNIYYWTLDGEWLLDGKGNKIQANGVNGTDGTNGTNGVTPQLKIENDYWYVSYDNGATWQQLGKATGEDGTSGIIINVEEGESEVAFTLADGSTITLPKSNNSKIVDENNKIYYTSTDGKKLFPYDASTKMFGAILISNTYEDGQGILTFDDTVTSIGEWAFYNCTSLTSVTIPDSVTSIGGGAFAYCTSLTSITIPDSVTLIGDYAFRGCNSLTSVTIPDSVTSIGEDAFWDCTSLTSVTIPNSVTSIGYQAFSYCRSLTSVTIPDSVTSIGVRAFSYCTSLTSVTIPDSVTSIGGGAFAYCDSLTSVTIPDSVTSIGDYAFIGCTSLTIVNITDLSAWCKISFNEYDSNPLYHAEKLYLNGNEVTALTIPSDITEIKSYAFTDCSSLTSITIPDSVTSIGNSAFCGCTSLTAFYGKFASTDNRCLIVDGVLNSFAPYGLAEYTIPNSVTSIGEDAFYKCTSLTSVTIGNGVTSIGIYAFYGCSGLTSITIPNGVVSIGTRAFSGCYKLASVYCEPTTPPTGGSSMFASNATGRKIYVPRASVDAYKSADLWKDYSNYILGYDF